MPKSRGHSRRRSSRRSFAGLPDGLDTVVGEAATRVSAGEARRLVVARTLLRDPMILILDEPTENLDPTTARQLLATLATATEGRTALLITHDPAAAAAFADETIHLVGGRISPDFTEAVRCREDGASLPLMETPR